jgi:hypothetical protein
MLLSLLPVTSLLEVPAQLADVVDERLRVVETREVAPEVVLWSACISASGSNIDAPSRLPL